MLAGIETEGDSLNVLLPVELGVSVVDGVAEGVRVPVGVSVALIDAVTLADSETLDVIEEDAPAVKDAVGVRELDAANVSVLVGVADAVPDGDGVSVAEPVRSLSRTT